MTIKDWLAQAETKLRRAGIDSARLDAELILSSVLGKERTWLIAHVELELNSPLRVVDDQDRRASAQAKSSDDASAEATSPAATDPIVSPRVAGLVDSANQKIYSAEQYANQLLKLRLQRRPLAYLLGQKEFYGRLFTVTPDVLIPRPDSEDIIDLLNQIKPTNLLDVGTGSGCLAISAKLELPQTNVTASDVSHAALKIAQLNADSLKAQINFKKSDLLTNITKNYDCIVANLPYVSTNWPTSAELKFEPELALYANDNGLSLVKKLVRQATKLQTTQQSLLLEADPRQHQTIANYAQNHGYCLTIKCNFILVLTKI